jgi:lipid-binding SYLF domain-containing protein
MVATVRGADELLALSKGVLVMPRVVKGGFIVGGEYGEGALRVGGETVAYYSVAAASFGLQAGAQASKQAILFMTEDALAAFRASKGWEAGLDAEVTVIDQGLAAGLDTTTRAAPVIGIVFGETGLLAGASVEGAKYTKLDR